MEKKPEVLYGYKVLEDGDQVAVWKENRAMMLFDKRLFSEDSLEGWRIARVLKEVENKIREEEREKMTAAIISISWGLWILSILWLMFKPSWISTLTFVVLMFSSFASVYWGGNNGKKEALCLSFSTEDGSRPSSRRLHGLQRLRPCQDGGLRSSHV